MTPAVCCIVNLSGRITVLVNANINEYVYVYPCSSLAVCCSASFCFFVISNAAVCFCYSSSCICMYVCVLSNLLHIYTHNTCILYVIQTNNW